MKTEIKQWKNMLHEIQRFNLGKDNNGQNRLKPYIIGKKIYFWPTQYDENKKEATIKVTSQYTAFNFKLRCGNIATLTDNGALYRLFKISHTNNMAKFGNKIINYNNEYAANINIIQFGTNIETGKIIKGNDLKLTKNMAQILHMFNKIGKRIMD